MNIIISENIGFCFGVKRAVDIALNVAKEDGSAHTYGGLIHNPQVVADLNSKGVIAVDDFTSLEKGNKLIIRSHGVSPLIFEKCRELGIEVVDATCPFVKRISEKAKYCNDNNIPLIIFGEATHPEIIGINGWFSGNAIIFSSSQEAEKMGKLDKAVIVAQTTANKDDWAKTLEIVKDKVLDLEIFDSICSSTLERQREAEKISEKCDIIIVIGGKQSSNTKKLFNICKENCPKTFHVEKVDEMFEIDFSKATNVGIISGASTPDWIIKEGIDYMSDYNKPTEENDKNDAAILEDTAEEKVEKKVEDNKDIKVTETEEQETVEEVVETPEVSEQEAETVSKEEEAKSLQEAFMEDVEKSLVQIKKGMVVTGKVVAVNDEEICVNIGYKADGIITKMEFSSDADVKMTDEVKEGDDIEVEVVRVRDEDGNVLLSRKNIESRKQWQALIDTYEEQDFFDCIGKQVVKGGLIATINGIRAFIPASHLDVRYVNDIAEYVGKQMKVKIIEVEKHRRRVVASRKEFILEQERLEKAELWDAIEEGSTVRGVVRRLTDFGAFVDIGGIDGLVHVTDLAWGRVNHPRDIVSVNEEIDVVVLKVDKERERISLGYKQTQPKPWDIAEDKYTVGAIVHGKVVRIVPFGAFVELEPGLDGLIHISQVAEKRIDKVEDVLQLNQEVDVKVLDINTSDRRISLSIRALTASDEPESDDYDQEDEAHSVLIDPSQYE